MFAGRQSGGTGSPPSSGPSSYPGPITQAAAQAQQRRLSVATAGLGTSPTQQSPFDNMRSRGQSISGSSSGSLDESPFEDSDGPPVSSNPASPFARRVSFGAQAMRDMRSKSGSAGSPSGNANGRPSVINVAPSDRPKNNAASSPPTAKNGRGLCFCSPERLPSRRARICRRRRRAPPLGDHSCLSVISFRDVG
ncbi:MAG: hypothetical protein INR71_03140 [Terriglobus roseus]|nr:hypothetical protein [Terriglobus roseus]